MTKIVSLLQLNGTQSSVHNILGRLATITTGENETIFRYLVAPHQVKAAR